MKNQPLLQVIVLQVLILVAALSGILMPAEPAGAAPRHAVWMWGKNDFGQFGNGDTTLRKLPVKVPRLKGIVAVAAGPVHTIALRGDGTVWAWGANYHGQLGDGTTTQRESPVRVHGLKNVSAVAAAWDYNLALKRDGTVWGWGTAGFGYGTVSGFRHLSPVRVPDLSGVVAVACGTFHALALRSDGTVWGWGQPDYSSPVVTAPGQSEPRPYMVRGIDKVVAIACGDAHSVAIRNDGTVWAWGDDRFGQLGDRTLAPDNTLESPQQDMSRTTPLPVKGLDNVVSVKAAAKYTMVIKRDGTLWSWGQEIPSGGSHVAPLPIAGLGKASFMAVGSNHAMALLDDGQPWAWGENQHGEIGNGKLGAESGSSLSVKPQPVSGLRGIRGLAVGWSHSVAVANDGTVWAWGDNQRGQVGDGTTHRFGERTRLRAFGHVQAVAAGWGFTMVLDGRGRIWTWGRNDRGQLGDGTNVDRAIPALVNGLDDVRAIANSGYGCLVLKNDGTVWGWGENTNNQLGGGALNYHLVPAQVGGVSDAVAIAAGGMLNLMLKRDGTVWACGLDTSPWLGTGDRRGGYPPENMPAKPVLGLKDVVSIAAGNDFGLAVKRDGTVWFWGRNWWGDSGDGTARWRVSPEQVPGLSGVASVVACNKWLALKRDGTVWHLPDLPDDQVKVEVQADGSKRSIRRGPATHIRGLKRIVAVTTGPEHSMALDRNGTVWVWGSNDAGQLGTDKIAKSTEPVRMRGIRGAALAAGWWNSLVVAR